MSECIVTYVHVHMCLRAHKYKLQKMEMCDSQHEISIFHFPPPLLSALPRPPSRRSVYYSFVFRSLLYSCVCVCVYVCQSLTVKFIFNALCIWDWFRIAPLPSPSPFRRSDFGKSPLRTTLNVFCVCMCNG